MAGIDFIAPDITAPVREAGGAICEVNAAPGFRMHTHPTIGEPQYIAKPVIDLLFPPGTPSRVPIVAVTGTNGKTTTSRMIGHVFKGMGRKVGMTSTDGVVIDERLVIRADASGPKSARMVLQNPRVDFAVLEVARGGILREGLGYDRNDVAVVLNVSADHLGMRGINTLEDLADVKSVVVEAVPRGGYAVLNADDPHVAADGPPMPRRASSGSRWTSPARRPRVMVDQHCRDGGVALVLEPRRARASRSSCARASARCRWRSPTCCPRRSAAGPGSTSPTRWPRPARASPPGRTCTTSAPGCGRSRPATTWRPAG